MVPRSVSHSWGEHVSPTYRGMEFSAFLCPAVPVHTARKGKSKDFSVVLPELSCGPQKALTASNLNFLGFKINALCIPGWLQTHDPPASLSDIPASSSYFKHFIQEPSQCRMGGRVVLGATIGLLQDGVSPSVSMSTASRLLMQWARGCSQVTRGHCIEYLVFLRTNGPCNSPLLCVVSSACPILCKLCLVTSVPLVD